MQEFLLEMGGMQKLFPVVFVAAAIEAWRYVQPAGPRPRSGVQHPAAWPAWSLGVDASCPP